MPDPYGALLRRAAARIDRGRLVVTDPGGEWVAGRGTPVVRVTIHDCRAYWAVVRHGSVGLADSYVAGWWDADDLTGLVRLLIDNLSVPMARLDRLSALASRPLSAWRQAGAPDPVSDRRNVRTHYDLPPALFTIMLDDSMTYSCGIFEHEEATLAEAQRAKLDRICRKLDLGPTDHVVEIGTGWGSFAIHAALTYGCRVTTTTVSAAQQEVATQRVADAGVADRVQVLGDDYRELSGVYDKLVSIEMIEAVDWRLHDTFFATCQQLLAPDGLMLLQSIVMADRSYERAKHHQDFIRRKIFPGSCIPSVSALCSSAGRATDLRLLDLEDIGRHYAPTLRSWCDNLATSWSQVEEAGLDVGFRRLWDLYLCYCEGAFLERHISNVQMVLAGPRFRAPLTVRQW